MADALQTPGQSWRQRLRRWWWHEYPDHPVDTTDPLGGALKDADLLIAFAAQSRRSIDPTKTEALAKAATKVAETRLAGQAVGPELSVAFWQSYDAFAVEIAPLSAHSIRASLRMNQMRGMRSLLTPTAVNALLAVLVFYVFLSLQSFWVAGKEMVDRADALEREKAELASKRTRNNTDVAASERQLFARSRDLCEATGDCATGAVPRGGNAGVKPATEPGLKATLRAEIRLLEDTLATRQRLSEELAEQQQALGFRSRPLEEMMANWYSRADTACRARLALPGTDLRPMAFLCSLKVESPAGGHDNADPVTPDLLSDTKLAPDTRRRDLHEEHKRLQALQRKQEESCMVQQDRRLAEQSSPAQAGKPKSEALQAFDPRLAWRGRADCYALSNAMREARLQQISQELADLDADRFSRVTTEVRMIVANLGTYLIALLMGLLGALTATMRSLSQQLRDHTYIPTTISEGVVRICLGAIAGVFGTLLVSTTGADPAMKSLPPIFVPFIFGYGIEIMFTMLDRLVHSFHTPDKPAGRS